MKKKVLIAGQDRGHYCYDNERGKGVAQRMCALFDSHAMLASANRAQ